MRGRVTRGAFVALGAGVAATGAAAAARWGHPFGLFETASDWTVPARLASSHPRLLLTAADFARLRSRATRDPHLKAWHAALSHEADALLAQPPAPYSRSLLTSSRQVLHRVYLLGVLAQIDHNAAYVTRAWQELDAATRFPDWNPAHFLDTAEMAHAVAIGYDWLHASWTPSQRSQLEHALATLGLAEALRAYQGATTPRANTDSSESQSGTVFNWWTTARHNWNIVCNGGIGLAALAIGDVARYQALASSCLTHALRSLRSALPGLAPDGGWPEGLAYWQYAISYLTAFIAGLDSALGGDFSLSQTPGLAQTGDFPLFLRGPSGQSFNFADSSSQAPDVPEWFWLAGRFGRPVYAAQQTVMADRRPLPQDLLWYRPSAPGVLVPTPPLDRLFHGVQVAGCRGSWSDAKATFVACKGGDNQANHADLDLGSFVLDALGVRWALDLGADDYALPGYFDNGIRGARWSYYRKRAEGHNTLVLNPDAGPDQDPLARAHLRAFVSTPSHVHTLIDLSAAYARHARAVRRGVALANRRRWVLLQDELHARAPASVWWFMHTGAERIHISQRGRAAILSQGAMRLWLRILSPAAAAFTVLAARPLRTSPRPAGQNGNTGIRRLSIHLHGVRDLRLAVLCVPLPPGAEPPPVTPHVRPLAAWPDGLPEDR